MEAAGAGGRSAGRSAGRSKKPESPGILQFQRVSGGVCYSFMTLQTLFQLLGLWIVKRDIQSSDPCDKFNSGGGAQRLLLGHRVGSVPSPGKTYFF